MKNIIASIISFFKSIFGIKPASEPLAERKVAQKTAPTQREHFEHYRNISHKRNKHTIGKSRKKNRSGLSRRTKNKHRRSA